jgi:hypothetical protein
LIYQSHHAWLAGDNAAAIAAADRASALAEAERDSALSLRAVFQRALGQLGAGAIAEAAAGMAEVAARAEDPALGGRFGLDAPLVVVALGYRARALTDLGALDAAQDAVAEAAAKAAVLRRPFSSIFVAVADGYLLLRRGRAAEAIARCGEAVALCAQAEADLMRPVALAFLGAARVAAGEAERGAAELQEAVEAAQAMGFLFQQPLRLALLARALRAAGREVEAAAAEASAAGLAPADAPRAAAVGAALLGESAGSAAHGHA